MKEKIDMKCQFSLCVRPSLEIVPSPEERTKSFARIKEWPEFEVLVDELDAERSPLKLLSCGVKFLEDHVRVQCDSYIYFRFTNSEANKIPRYYYDFFHQIAERLHGQLSDLVNIGFEIRKTEFNNNGFIGYAALLRVVGYGKARAEARDASVEAYSRLVEFVRCYLSDERADNIIS